MYFWRIESLKNQLRRGALSQQLAFRYLLATMLLYTAAISVPSGSGGDPGPITAIDLTAYAATIVLVAAGTYAAYRANGGPGGADFVHR